MLGTCWCDIKKVFVIIGGYWLLLFVWIAIIFVVHEVRRMR
jgi:hypothetical protein